MANYMEVHSWLRGLGFPANSSEYAALEAVKQSSGEGLKSDCSVIILDAKKRPNIKVTFYDAFPIYLSGFILSTTQQQVDYVTSTMTFKYTYFDIERLT